MDREWTAERILELTRGYQGACVLAAGAELGVFAALAVRPRAAAELAAELGLDARATRVLLDALAALGLLEKRDDRYCVSPDVDGLVGRGARLLAMVRHHANCLRRWARLAEVVQQGRPAAREPSVRGAEADTAAFVEAMNDINAGVADALAAELQLEFGHLLDVGGATGTWALAFLRSHPAGMATIFDLPPAIALARRRVAAAGMADRVRLVAGDFTEDPLPGGADVAWVSAIVHQNSRAENRALFQNIRTALAPGGRILIRDYVMAESRIEPAGGALFAVNMLVGTEGGATFTFAELAEDLCAAGFVEVALLREEAGMSSVVAARKPGAETMASATRSLADLARWWGTYKHSAPSAGDDGQSLARGCEYQAFIQADE